jgi:hypothetical protein
VARLRAVHGAIAFAMLGTALPWIDDGPGWGRSGLGEPDGILVLVVCVATTALAAFGTRVSWLAAGFGAVVAIRDVFVVRDAGVTVGVGLWLTVIALGIAAVWLLIEMVRDVRTATRGAGQT